MDVAPGKGIDRVCPGQELDEPADSFGVVVSCECFEHNPFWGPTLANMVRMLEPGGLCIVSCASLGRREHGTPRTLPAVAGAPLAGHYYRNLQEKDFRRALPIDKLFAASFFRENIYRKDLYFVGIKPPPPGETVDCQRLQRLARRVGEIRREAALGAWSRVRPRLTHPLRVAFDAVLGEKRVHDLRYIGRRFERSVKGRLSRGAGSGA